MVQQAIGLDVTAQQTQGLLPHQREQALTLHHAAAQNDLFGADGDDQVLAHLGQIMGLDLENGMIVRQLPCVALHPRADGGAGGKAFQTAVMIGAYAVGNGVLGMGTEQHMPHLGVQQTVDGMAAHHHAAADAGADSHIDHIAAALGRAHFQLGQRSGVHVGVDGGGNVLSLQQLRQQGVILPFQLGGGGDVAVGGGIRVRVQRAEAAYAQRVDLPAVEKLLHGRHGHRRFFGGDGHSFQFLAGLVKGGQHHFGAAGFQCADGHVRSFFPDDEREAI